MTQEIITRLLLIALGLCVAVFVGFFIWNIWLVIPAIWYGTWDMIWTNKQILIIILLAFLFVNYLYLNHKNK